MIESDGEDKEICAICIEELAPPHEYALECKHKFHPWCMLSVVCSAQGGAKCPLCRARFRGLEVARAIPMHWVGWLEFFIRVLAASMLIYMIGGSPWSLISHLYFIAALGWITPTRRNSVFITVRLAH